MKKEKQVCDFNLKHFNKIKRKDVQEATRPSSGKGKPIKDTSAPIVSNVLISNITSTSLTISWNTNEQSTCILEYGISTNYGQSEVSSQASSHSIILSSLLPNTSYNFRIVATDLSGNTSYSSNYLTSTSGAIDKVFYLEFYGRTVSLTTWNVSGPIVATHSGLTQSEIDSILLSIQKHYEKFNVLVTLDIDVYNNTPVSSKQIVIFTEYNEWYGDNIGGIAYLNSFGWSDQSPAWVFTKLLNYNAHDIAEAGAHEMGHTCGCRHQVTCENGVIISAYNWGDGITAPIMGASYNVPSGDWWIGPNSLGCSNIQDDIQILTNKLGLKQQ